ncbi:MAG: hypothetical protein ABIS86_11460 [Streptosporangiaceae bacterium]
MAEQLDRAQAQAIKEALEWLISTRDRSRPSSSAPEAAGGG